MFGTLAARLHAKLQASTEFGSARSERIRGPATSRHPRMCVGSDGSEVYSIRVGSESNLVSRILTASWPSTLASGSGSKGCPPFRSARYEYGIGSYDLRYVYAEGIGQISASICPETVPTKYLSL